MNEVWEAGNVNAVEVGDNRVEVDGQVTPEDVKQAASDAGVKKFKVENGDGYELDQDEFPVDGTVQVKEYNENA